MEEIVFHRLESLTDPVVPDVLDIFQQAFPPHEQMRISFYWRYLNAPQTQENKQYRFYCMKLGEEVIGFSFFEIGEEVDGLGKPGYIWYFAIREDMRCKKYGVHLYEFVKSTVSSLGCCALTFETGLVPQTRREGSGGDTLSV
jgi:ribosomal protein S18 acetylase RimI-like enzyme